MAAFFVATSCRRADWMLIGLLLGLLLAAAVSSGQAAPLANYDDSAEDGLKAVDDDLPAAVEQLLQQQLLQNLLAYDQVKEPARGAGRVNHQKVRKSDRYPSLRMRFGRRSDPAMGPARPSDASE